MEPAEWNSSILERLALKARAAVSVIQP